MKILKSIMLFFVYYILGYLIFNLIIFITQFSIYAILGLELNLVDSYVFFIKNNILSYTIIYLFLLVVYLIYNMVLIRILNKKLERVKKVGGENEK